MIRSIRVDDFTGGLNLDSNSFRVGSNESGDLLNVDLNPKGGVSSRWGFRRSHTTAIGGFTTATFIPAGLFAWNGLTKRLMLASNNGVYWSYGRTTADNFTNLSLATNSEAGADFANWDREDDSVLYIARGTNTSYKWLGTGAATALTASGGVAGLTEWQDDLAVNTGTHCPKASFVATHAERLWVAGVTEGAATYPNRVRFSHPLFPESWRKLDFIDIPAGGDKITAIVPFGGHLLVFKKQSTWAIYGYNEDTFQVVQLSGSVGAMSLRSVAVSDSKVYFYGNPDGLFVYDGSSVQDLFVNLRPLKVGAEINEEAVGAVTVGWCNRRLYLSLPTGADPSTVADWDEVGLAFDSPLTKWDGGVRATNPTLMFVYDEQVGKGAWTVYQGSDRYGLMTPLDFIDDNGMTHYVAVHPKQPYIYNVDTRSTLPSENHQDYMDGTATNFNSYYVTSWQDASSVASKKFWRRPEFVLRRESTDTDLVIKVYQDWDSVTPVKTFEVHSDGLATPSVGWQSFLEPDFGSVHEKGGSLGRARAVALKIVNKSGWENDPLPSEPVPTTPAALGWGMYSLTYKYNPRGTGF